MKVKIFSTKKLLPSNDFNRLLNPLLFEFSSDSFIKISPLVIPRSQQIHSNVLITSKNSLPEFQKHLQISKRNVSNFSFWCVGEKTAQRITTLFHPPTFVAQSAYSLSKQLLYQKNERFSYLCGKSRLDILPQTLTKYGMVFNEIHTYQTEILAKKITVTPDAVLFFSPSGVKGFFAKNTLEKGVAFSIGSTTTKALIHYTKKKVITSQEASLNSILDTVITHFSRYATDTKRPIT